MARVIVRDIVITTLLLGVFAATGAGLVAWVHLATADRITENRIAVTRMRVTEVLQGLEYDNDPVVDATVVSDPLLGGTGLPVWFARHDEAVVGMVLTAIAPNGYSGAIHLLVGVDTEGQVLGVRVTQHQETPGLGDDIEADRSDWIQDFRSRALGDPPIEDWRVRKDGGIFDQFTGATVTPRAVVQAVRNALVYVREHGDALQATPAVNADEALVLEPLPPAEAEPVAPGGPPPPPGTPEDVIEVAP